MGLIFASAIGLQLASLGLGYCLGLWLVESVVAADLKGKPGFWVAPVISLIAPLIVLGCPLCLYLP